MTKDHENSSSSVVILNIAVGSDNPSKLKAVKAAFEQVVATNAVHTNKTKTQRVQYHLEGFTVESGVPDQPFGDVSLWFYLCLFVPSPELTQVYHQSTTGGNPQWSQKQGQSSL
jgi:hypothetical protein